MTSQTAETRQETIETVEELLAHGKALEEEAAERYEEIADAMEVHNNREVAALFRQLNEYALKHAAEINERAQGLTLPHISPWDYKWQNGSSPETASLEATHYLMTPYHALLVAHKAENGAHDFYATVAATSGNTQVRDLAAEFAEEEAGHVMLLEEWIQKTPKPEDGWDYDPDPPFMSE